MASRPPGRDPAGGGRDVFRSQLQIQESRDGHQDGVKPGTESDSESLSSQSSIFHQGRVPISWLVSESGSSSRDRSERASASGGKGDSSRNTSSSSSIEQQAGAKGLSATVTSGLQAVRGGYSSSSWFATTFEESDVIEEKAIDPDARSSGLGHSTFSYMNAALQSEAESEPKEMEVPPDLQQRCMDILMSLPTDEEGRLTSLGSLSHKTGTCKPCAYWFKRACKHGVACYNCHIAHEGQKPKRLRSSKAKMTKEISDVSIPEEDELTQKDWKKNMNERAIPSAPGPVGEGTVDLKVTAALLKQMSLTFGFQVTEPARSSVPAPSPTKTSL